MLNPLKKLIDVRELEPGTEPVEFCVGISRKDLIGPPAGVDRNKDGDQTAYDMGVAIQMKVYISTNRTRPSVHSATICGHHRRSRKSGSG